VAQKLRRLPANRANPRGFRQRARDSPVFLLGALFATRAHMTSHHTFATGIEETQVLIVGGGPVGLVAGLWAAKRGLQVTVLEQNFRGYARGYATLLHPASLRLLSELGLSKKVVPAGRPMEHVRVLVDGESVARLNLPLPALAIAQSVLEEILLQALRAARVDLRSPCEATSFNVQPEFVDVGVTRRELVALGAPAQDGDWEPVKSSLIRARFVIGADGYDSAVRGALASTLIEAGPTETFAMFEGPEAERRPELELAFAGGLASIQLPLPGQRCRWGFQLASDFTRPPDLEHLRALFAQQRPAGRALPERVDWSTVTHFERRLASPFGRGRLWLAGDAAHVTSPFGGQSMNSGLLEAETLVDGMAECITGGRDVESLGRISAAHVREWQRMLAFKTRFELSAAAPSWLAEHARALLPALPVTGRDLQLVLSELGLVIH
jgi:2-polyprenyl-6-methoxyphenol hydroxylase-like FAD-dependent oxidoreductase